MDKDVSKRFLGHADYLQEIVKIINGGEQIDTDSLYELQYAERYLRDITSENLGEPYKDIESIRSSIEDYLGNLNYNNIKYTLNKHEKDTLLENKPDSDSKHYIDIKSGIRREAMLKDIFKYYGRMEVTAGIMIGIGYIANSCFTGIDKVAKVIGLIIEGIGLIGIFGSAALCLYTAMLTLTCTDTRLFAEKLYGMLDKDDPHRYDNMSWWIWWRGYLSQNEYNVNINGYNRFKRNLLWLQYLEENINDIDENDSSRTLKGRILDIVNKLGSVSRSGIVIGINVNLSRELVDTIVDIEFLWDDMLTYTNTEKIIINERLRG